MSVYEALDKLAETGLVTVFHEDNKRLFLPTSPKKLQQIVEDFKEKQLIKAQEMQKELSAIIPRLQAKYESVKEKELFEIYRGRKAYKSILNEIIKEEPACWKGFGNLQVQEYFPIEFQKWFKHCPIRLFSTRSSIVRKRLENAQKTANVKILWLPQEVYMPIVWVVFGDNVLIIIYEPDIIVIRIKSKHVITTFSNQFEYLWKKYKQ
ncbi:hypothetical protein HZC31_06445 [Candidatus Woesearchaeota archaeon]|nr:hypothetical protein [Candidatus Woesearchaeota archaeon]